MDAWIRFVEHSTYSTVQKKWKQNLVDFVLCSRENLTKFCKHPQNFTIVKIHIHKISPGEISTKQNFTGNGILMTQNLMMQNLFGFWSEALIGRQSSFIVLAIVYE